MVVSVSRGQSKTDYLLTYGWMILVVAIVGGAITATVLQQSKTCESQITDIDAQSNSFGVSDFSYSGNDVNLRFANGGGEEVNVTGLDVAPARGGPPVEALSNESAYMIVRSGNSAMVEVEDGLASYGPNKCGALELAVNYSEGGIDNSISGKIQGTV